MVPNPFRAVPYIEARRNVPLTALKVIHSLHETLESQGYIFLLTDYTAKKAEINCDDISLTFTNEEGYLSVMVNKEPSRAVAKKDDVWELGRLSLRSSEATPAPYLTEHDLISENALLFSSTILTKFGFKYLRQNWIPIANCGVCRKIAQDVSKLVQDEYIDLTMEPFLGRLSINVYLRDGRRIRLGDLGEGVQNYIVARILYESENYKILLWDDVEAHMNPIMLMATAQWLSKLVEKGDQVILTTHSLEATRIIASMAGDKCNICLTSLENGVLNSRKLSLGEVEKLLEAGVDIRSASGLLI